MSNLDCHISKFKKLVNDVFETHCDAELYTMKFDLLDHLVEDLSKFGALERHDSSGFKLVNAQVKSVCWSTSRRNSSVK